MRRPRFQFRLSTLLWITLAVACWFGGREVQRREDEQVLEERRLIGDALESAQKDIREKEVELGLKDHQIELQLREFDKAMGILIDELNRLASSSNAPVSRVGETREYEPAALGDAGQVR